MAISSCVVKLIKYRIRKKSLQCARWPQGATYYGLLKTGTHTHKHKHTHKHTKKIKSKDGV